MSIFTESQIRQIFDRNLEFAVKKLSELEVFCGNRPKFTGLSGWVFEQTIHHCLNRELSVLNIPISVTEQSTLAPRVKVDLQIGSVFLEIKFSGCYSADDAGKYKRYREIAAGSEVSRHFLFLSCLETHRPYRDAMMASLGTENVFYLDIPGEWGRFIRRLLELNKLQS